MTGKIVFGFRYADGTYEGLEVPEFIPDVIDDTFDTSEPVNVAMSFDEVANCMERICEQAEQADPDNKVNFREFL